MNPYIKVRIAWWLTKQPEPMRLCRDMHCKVHWATRLTEQHEAMWPCRVQVLQRCYWVPGLHEGNHT